MPAQAFLDTNILVYAFGSNDAKKRIAEQLVLGGAVVGVQTLNEFVSVVGGKLKAPWPQILTWLGALRIFCPEPVPITLNIHQNALRIAQTYRYNIYDALMLAAALEANCTLFYSEDLQHNQRIEGLTLLNPFA